MMAPIRALAALLLIAPALVQAQGPLANTTDTIPASWSGPKFEMSKDYPAAAPQPAAQPWKQIDFKTASAAYMQAILDYCLDGNEAVDWVVQNNTVRKWYHAPGLVGGQYGREFVRGLTRERSSRPKELHEKQTSFVQNWGIGFYNPVGGFTLGQVWKNPASPDPTKATFGEGTVSFKLLFTRALVKQVPYLTKAFKWKANIARNGKPTQVKLLQIDIAVKDSRATQTGWVFGTFVYQGKGPGAKPFDRMVPVCLMWGNDPDLKPADHAGGARPQETWLNPALVGPPPKLPHFGWLDRGNGPVDNPRSSCLSCHMTAQWPIAPRMYPRANDSETVKMGYFRNLAPGVAFAPPAQSLDYSQQLAVGLRNFPGSLTAANLGGAVADAAPSFAFREGSREDSAEVADVGIGPDDPDDDEAATGTGIPLWVWVIAGFFGVVLLLILISKSK